MTIGLLNLEKAYGTIPMEIAMATLRWMGDLDAAVRMVDGTYEDTKSRVLCGPGVSVEFKGNIGLRLGAP